MKPKEYGFLENGTGKHQSNTLWSISACSPTITTITGGGTIQIKILDKVKQKMSEKKYVGIKQATLKGYAECEIGGLQTFSIPQVS